MSMSPKSNVVLPLKCLVPRFQSPQWLLFAFCPQFLERLGGPMNGTLSLAKMKVEWWKQSVLVGTLKLYML